MEEELALSTPRIDLVLQYLQDRCTPFLCSCQKTDSNEKLDKNVFLSFACNVVCLCSFSLSCLQSFFFICFAINWYLTPVCLCFSWFVSVSWFVFPCFHPFQHNAYAAAMAAFQQTDNIYSFNLYFFCHVIFFIFLFAKFISVHHPFPTNL